MAAAAVTLAYFSIPPARVWSQAEQRYKELQVSLWPEYDKPGVLVIYRITLPDEVSLPAEVTVRIPSTAQVNAVATRQEDGSLTNAATERVVNGEWAEISFTTPTPGAQIEYYDTSLNQDGNLRNYEFNWPGDYAVDAFGIEVQQPLGATSMFTSPSLGTGKTGQDGLTYYTAELGALPQGQDFRLSLQYNKEDDTLSAAGLTVQPSTPVDNSPSWLISLRAALPWGLVALGLLLILGGGIWYWQSGRRQGERKEARHRHKPASTAEHSSSSAPSAGGQVYCHSCGKRAAPGDRFCRTCGSQLRQG
jgi:hypothetical protein